MSSAVRLIALLWCGACTPSPPQGSEAPAGSGGTGSDGGVIRAVSLAPSVSELVFAIGASGQLVGRSTWCNEPPAVVALPVAGSALTPDMETLIALSATHVLAPADQQHEPWVASLDGLGMTYVAVRDHRLEDIPAAMVELGEVLNAGEGAAAAAASFRGRLALLRAQAPPGVAVPTLVVVGMDPLYVAGGDSRMNELLELAGGSNVVGQGDWVQLEAESLLALDPALIVTLGPPDEVEWARRFPSVRAVAQGRLCGVDADRISRPGPRILDAVDELAGCVRMAAVEPAAVEGAAGSSGSE